MATSGSYNFNLAKTDLINHTLRTLNLLGDNETASSGMMDYASESLNMMIKAWQATDIQLWNRRRGTLFTAYQTASYSIGPSGDNATNTYNSTTLDAAEASGQTVLSVTSTSGFSNGDNIGITLDDSTRQWTTISSFVTDDTVTVAAALTGAAASGNRVVTYTSKMQRPLRILQATLKNLSDSVETPLTLISYDQYFNYPNKTTNGRPSQFYYDKLLTNGKLYLYPRPNDVNWIIDFTYHEAIEDLDSTTDDVDFPTEWFDALSFNLAVRLCPRYGKYKELDYLMRLADMYRT